MFTVAVKIEGLDRRRRTAGYMHIIVGFFLLLKIFDLNKLVPDEGFTKLLPFILAATLSLIYGFFLTRIDATARYNGPLRGLQFVTFVLFGAVMLRAGKTFDGAVLFAWAAVTFLLIFSEKKLFADTFLKLSDAGIRIPGTYKEHLIEWPMLEDVTVRRDFITLFHRHKKYLQYQVMLDLSEPELIKMNAFCRKKIESATANRHS